MRQDSATKRWMICLLWNARSAVWRTRSVNLAMLMSTPLRIIRTWWSVILSWRPSMTIWWKRRRRWKASSKNWIPPCANSLRRNSQRSAESSIRYSRSSSVVVREHWNWWRMRIFWRQASVSSHSPPEKSFRTWCSSPVEKRRYPPFPYCSQFRTWSRLRSAC